VAASKPLPSGTGYLDTPPKQVSVGSTDRMAADAASAFASCEYAVVHALDPGRQWARDTLAPACRCKNPGWLAIQRPVNPFSAPQNLMSAWQSDCPLRL
jgi:hypothetical protein